MAIATLATFQRFRWLLIAAVLSFILILLTLSSGISLDAQGAKVITDMHDRHKRKSLDSFANSIT